MMKRFALLALSVLTVSATYASAGTTYYVSTSGSDGNSCATARSGDASPASARRSIMAGVACLTAGDTLRVRGGTYTGRNNLIDAQNTTFGTFPSGTNWTSGAIRIEAYPGEAVVVQPPPDMSGVRITRNWIHYVIIDGRRETGASMTFTGINSAFDGSNDGEAAIIYDADHIELRSLTFRKWPSVGLHFGPSATEPQGYPNFKIIGNEIDDIGYGYGSNRNGHCMYLTLSDSLIQGNVVHGCDGYAIQLYNNRYDGIAPFRNIIEKNLVYNYGRHLGTSTCPDCDASGVVASQGDANIIRNNIFANSLGSGITVYSNARDTKVLNNTAYNLGRECVSLQFYNDGTVLQNNLCYATKGIRDWGSFICDTLFASLGAIPCGYTSTANITSGNPNFVNPGNYDFHLTAASAIAINQGVPSSDVTDDFDGNARDWSPDIGAYEYGGSAPAAPPVSSVTSDGSTSSAGASDSSSVSSASTSGASSQLAPVAATAADGSNASSLLDGDVNTKWLADNVPSAQDEVVIALDGSRTVTGLQYDETWTRVASFEVYVSSDGSNWGSRVNSSTAMPADGVVSLSPTQGGYVKFKVTGADRGANYAYLSELRLYGY